MEKEEKKKNWMHEHGIEKAEFVKEAITVLRYNLGESRSVFFISVCRVLKAFIRCFKSIQAQVKADSR